jgi:hypothetical protein
MNLFRQIFGFRPPKAANSSHSHSQVSAATSTQSKGSAPSPASTRRELLRVVLRDTLNRHGIPTAWISPEMLLATSRGREPGIHLRLLLRHWDPRLLTHAVALQNSLIVRLLAFDPLASNWLIGISWQFALPDDAVCPPMPHPGWWTAEPRSRQPEQVQVELAGGSGDVIAGPVRIGAPPPPIPAQNRSTATRAELEQLLAIRDADVKLNAATSERSGAEPTQPMYLLTQPQPLEGDSASLP